MHRKIGNWLALIVVLGGFSLVGPEGRSQDGSDSPTLEQRLAEWADLDARFCELEAKIEVAGPEAEAARAEYQQLIATADAAIESIETAATAELRADRSSKVAIRALMGIMMNEARRGRDAKVLSIGDFLIGKGINPGYFEIAAKSEQLQISQKELFDELLLRHAETMANDLPRVKLTTTRGDIVLELFENQAPGTVGNFIHLVELGFYDGLLFHRVVEGFMAQGGGYKLDDADQQVEQSPGYEIKCECYTPEARLHFTGSLSMAKRIPRDTGGSQFFLTLERTSFLDGRHTVFGRVIEGGDVLDTLVRTHLASDKSGTGQEEPIEGAKPEQILKAVVIRKRDHEYVPDKSATVPATGSSAADGQ